MNPKSVDFTMTLQSEEMSKCLYVIDGEMMQEEIRAVLPTMSIMDCICVVNLNSNDGNPGQTCIGKTWIDGLT